ncbi:MAG: AbrB/MazE/SpoVT family DNA-binding domain-containing protein [Candidatus Aenigmarchaeota archaeon]|nr:AbrB/MazE/SpoVT family DNA-binding domain-containing protein [Candidatus Aenigmarchaeota archaeon]
MTQNIVSKIGPKGQIVLKKKLRDKAGLKEGMLVEEELMEEGILIRPMDAGRLMKGMEELAKKVSRKWPKDLDSAGAVRRERR